MECLKSKRNVKRCRCRKWIMLLYIKNCDDKKMGNIIPIIIPKSFGVSDF